MPGKRDGGGGSLGLAGEAKLPLATSVQEACFKSPPFWQKPLGAIRVGQPEGPKGHLGCDHLVILGGGRDDQGGLQMAASTLLQKPKYSVRNHPSNSWLRSSASRALLGGPSMMQSGGF